MRFIDRINARVKDAPSEVLHSKADKCPPIDAVQWRLARSGVGPAAAVLERFGQQLLRAGDRREERQALAHLLLLCLQGMHTQKSGTTIAGCISDVDLRCGQHMP